VSETHCTLLCAVSSILPTLQMNGFSSSYYITRQKHKITVLSSKAQYRQAIFLQIGSDYNKLGRGWVE